MGNCGKNGPKKVVPVSLPEADALVYPAFGSISAPHTSRRGSFLEFPFSHPISSESRHLSVSSLSLWLSDCCILGEGPFNTDTPACQDSHCCLTDGTSLLLAVFDGHGSAGKELVTFCRKRTTAYYGSAKEKYMTDPRKMISDLVKMLDVDTRSHNAEFNCEDSGCTVTILLLFQGKIYTACVGDLKAVVGTYDKSGIQVAEPRIHPLGYQSFIDQLRNSRFVTLSKSIFSLKITQDKRPEDMTEVVRIVRSGGRVHRPQGKTEGPTLVWRGELEHPGLTVSRAIGDTDCNDLGVICEAEMTEYELRMSEDQFVVVGTSGLWEVMEEVEVVKFVEKYRETCVRGEENWQHGTPVTATSVSIAHLLCNEVRMRWLPILEKEQCDMEDTTIIILEFD